MVRSAIERHIISLKTWFEVAIVELGPRGQVRVGHERWSAESAGGAIPAGSSVRVVGWRGLRLIVEPGPTVSREATERTVRE